MRIFNKMKKTMLVLAASLFAVNVAFAEEKTTTRAYTSADLPDATNGITLTLDGITVHHGPASSKTDDGDYKWTWTDNKSVDGYTGYFSSNDNPRNESASGANATVLPVAGAFVKYQPAYDGKIAAAVVSNNGKTNYLLEVDAEGTITPITTMTATGTFTLADDGGFSFAEKLYGVLTFNVTAGKTYYLFTSGSKMSFYGFMYTYDAPAAAPALDFTAYDASIEYAKGKLATLDPEADAMLYEAISMLIEENEAFKAEITAATGDEAWSQEDVDRYAEDFKATVDGYIAQVEAEKLMAEVATVREEASALWDSYPEDIRTDNAGLANAMAGLPRNSMGITAEQVRAAIDAVKTAMEAFKAENDANVAGGDAETVELTEDLFKAWDKIGVDAQVTGDATSEMGIGKEIGGGAMVYGASTVDPLLYADLSAYEKMIIEGTPGMVIRVLMNRELGGEPGSFTGALVEVKPAIGENGKAEVDFTTYDYVHLNAMKTDWGGASGTISKISLVKAAEPEVPTADSLKIGEVTILEAGKTYVLGKQYEMYKVQFAAEKDGFLSITPSQKISSTSLKINGASSTFTKDANGGISKKGMAAGSVFEGTFYCSGTPSAENVYELVVTFEEGTPYFPLALTLASPVDGGEWSGAAEYKSYGTKGVPHYEFSTLIGTDVKASVKIGDKVYENIKLTVDGYYPKLDITALPDTMSKAIAAGLIKAGETFTLTLSNIVDKEFAANTLTDQTFTYTLASTACTGVSPTVSTSRTTMVTDVTFSFDGKVALADTAKFYMVNLANNEVTELTGEVVEGTSVKVTVPAIEGLLPRLYNIVATGVTTAEGDKVITYGNEPGKLVASYGTGNGFFKGVTSLQNWGQVCSLKGFTATYPGEVIAVEGIATKPITFTKVNVNTGAEEEMPGVTLGYTVNGNVIEFALSEAITEVGTYRFSVPQKHFWAKDTYTEEDAKLSTPKYAYYQASITLTIDVIEPTATDVTDKLVNPNFDDANANTGWNAGSKDLQFGTSGDAQKLKDGTIFVGNIVEHWEGSAWTGDIAQTVKELPAGAYKFTMGAYVNNAGEAYIFANDSLSVKIDAAKVGQYTTYVELAEGADLKVGFKNVSGINWICLDNAHLYYYGEGTTVDMALKADWNAVLAAVSELKAAYADPIEVEALDAVVAAAKIGNAQELLASIKAVETAMAAFKKANDYNAVWNATNAKLADATAENPVDATGFIKNASFEEGGTAIDWTTSYTTNSNWGNHGVVVNIAGAQDGKNGFETWSPQLSSVDLHQEVRLPAGSYVASAALRTELAGQITNQHVYVKIGEDVDSSAILLAPTATPWNSLEAWQTLSVAFSIEEETVVTIGAASSSDGTETSKGWFQIDNFRLSCTGWVDPALQPAVDSLNALVVETEAFQKTLDLTDGMQAAMNESLVQTITAAKAAAEAKESVAAVRAAYTQLNMMYIQIVANIAGAEAQAAQALMGEYENPTDEAGLANAITKVMEIYSNMMSNPENTYTVADLNAAVEAMRTAKDAFVKENTKITEVSVSLTHTASSYCETDANAYISTVDAAKEHVNNSKFSGTWQGAAYAEFSVLLPEGISIKSATLTWSGIGSSKDRTTDIMYVNAGETLDYETMKSTGTEKVNLPATNIATVTFKASKTTDFTTDVTEAVKTVIGSGQNYVIFKFTNNVGAGDIVGKGAAEKAPVLTLETVDASMMTSYTVKYVDEAGAELKAADVYGILIGETATLADENKAPFYNEDNTKKYVYVSCDKESIVTVADSASNVITATFREAAKYNYTVETTDDSGSLAITMGSYSGFEGENVKVPYYAYVLNEADSTLYQAAATNKEYNKYVDLTQDNMKVQVAYTPTTIKNIVYYQEAENVEGLTKVTTGNTTIRSSNSASAYAADADVVLTTLAPGKYKLAAVIYDATKALNSEFSFIAGSDTILKAVSTAANWTNCVSEEFTLTANTTLSLAKGGSSSKGVDLFYIQKTGDVELPAKVAYLCGATETTEAIYTALTESGYDVTPLNYDEVTLTEEVVANDFVGKYDVVVLAGATKSGSSLAATHNLLIGKVNVLSTKAFWYNKTTPAGTNGTNPGTADAPSTGLVKVAGYEEHPIYAGIEGAEFAVFNESEAITNGRYFQGNGALSGIEQATIGTTLGANCIGEAWVDGKGWMIIPVDGDNSANFSLTADGAQLFVNAVDYLIAGEQFEYNLVEGVRVEATQWPADIYDLSGRMIKKAATSLEGLDKGLYFIQGKKVLVK